MAAKKKISKPSEEERRPPVTQVVEVVEEAEEPTVINDAPAENIETEDSQKRRELVDELFQKKSEPVEPAAVMPEISIHKKPSLRPMIMWAIVLVVAVAVVGGVILLVSGTSSSLPTLFAAPTATPTMTATPSPTPDVSSLDRPTVTVQVLNGSGVVGSAGKMKTLLEEKGYTVADTGNAETYEYETTEIHVKAEKEAFLTLLTEDLKESYTLATVTATLESDVPYDVRIIVGKE